LAISPYLRQLRELVGHELVALPSVAVMIFDAAGRLLLVRAREFDRWQTVGGAIDPDESPADAALREAHEESGLEVELTRVIGVYGGPLFRLVYPNGDVCSYTAISFAARPRGGAIRPDGDETVDVAWFTREAAASLQMAPHTRLLVDEAFRHDPAARFDRPSWHPAG
jgi:8-oxo-dGTP pyrophosphatase MutT (NUDIX family)